MLSAPIKTLKPNFQVLKKKKKKKNLASIPDEKHETDEEHHLSENEKFFWIKKTIMWYSYSF